MRSEYIIREEFEHLLAALMPINRLVMEFALWCGLRVGDVLALKTSDVQKGDFYLREAKTGKRHRIRLTRKWKERLLSVAGKIYVFEGRTSNTSHRTRQTVWKDVRRAAILFRIPQHVTPHTARKIYAVDALRKWGDLRRVQRALAHENSTVTLLYAYADHMAQRREPRRRREAV